MVLSITYIQPVSWKIIQANFLSLLMTGTKNQESRFVKHHCHSLQEMFLLRIFVVAQEGALQKDVDAYGME